MSERVVKSEMEMRPYCAKPYADAESAEAGIEAFLKDVQALMEKHNIFAVAGCFSADYGEDSYCSGNMFMGVTDQALMSAIQDVREVSMHVIRQKAMEEMARELRARQPESTVREKGPRFPSGWKRVGDGASPPSEVAEKLRLDWVVWGERNFVEYADELYEPVFEG